ncbi:oxygen-insensitive NADPH nitroreductase [Alkalihalobacillus oceani]|uniref:Oxygen-insensitive NADPH nitroreductase n=1 Tax=Halalkalibacter oceani TaxID=1653776 RepID=A0A9X2DVW3_9BACI|nr:oxygen-insensitive NADPH nitroreductase [Halalkalibacter oceani]MCM3716502.1 oxygen-insensitive NADPH nitroreductase [Halalkalibacter oceani]
MKNAQHDEMIHLLRNHRSIREFQQKRIPPDLINTVLTAGQAASSSSHGQSYTIINVTDDEKKRLLADYAGKQTHIRDCSNFLVFCADLYRLEQIASLNGVNLKEVIESTEMLLISTIDAALAAQNVAIAAESLQLGIVYIGGIRNNPEQVSELLELPYRVYPVFGMCVGYPQPDKVPDSKPRLPLAVVCHENSYSPFEDVYPEIQEYDEEMRDYYANRSHGSRTATWSGAMLDKRKVPRRMFMKHFLNQRGFSLR